MKKWQSLGRDGGDRDWWPGYREQSDPVFSSVKVDVQRSMVGFEYTSDDPRAKEFDVSGDDHAVPVSLPAASTTSNPKGKLFHSSIHAGLLTQDDQASSGSGSSNSDGEIDVPATSSNDPPSSFLAARQSLAFPRPNSVIEGAVDGLKQRRNSKQTSGRSIVIPKRDEDDTHPPTDPQWV